MRLTLITIPSTTHGPHSLINDARNISSDASDTVLAAFFLSLQWLANLWITASFQSKLMPSIAASNNLTIHMIHISKLTLYYYQQSYYFFTVNSISSDNHDLNLFQWSEFVSIVIWIYFNHDLNVLSHDLQHHLKTLNS